jgi:hypothetical protein
MAPEKAHQADALRGVGDVIRYGVEHAGHDIEVEFDRRKVIINAARLTIDGELVDQTRIFYGEKDLRATTDDGHEIVVAVDSGMAGELTRLQLKREDGTWIDLPERGAP